MVEEEFRAFTEVKVAVQSYRNILFQGNVLQSNVNLRKRTEVSAPTYT